jgi:hypothetical protein
MCVVPGPASQDTVMIRIHVRLARIQVKNFTVLCSVRMLGTGPNLSDKSAKDISRSCGGLAVHHLHEARARESDIPLHDGVWHINPPNQHGGPPANRQKIDLCRCWQDRVEGMFDCHAAPTHPTEHRER